MMPAMQDTAVHLSDRHFRTIAELIEGQVGIKLPQGKRLMLEGRLHKRVRADKNGMYRWDPSGRDGVGTVFTTAVFTMMLSMPYHYIPLYQR